MNTKTMTIKELIKGLQDIEKAEGDMRVLLAKDPEGNGFGTLEPAYSFGTDAETKPTLVLYPYAELLEIEDLDQ